MQLPNLISVLRLGTAPVLLWLAWYGYSRAVLVALGVSFASDVLDGYLARRLGQTSALGAQLDSVGDFAIYVTIPIVGWWLWPDIIRREAPYFIAVIASTILPPVFGYGKFRTSTSYHTWAAKLAALLVGGSVILLFAGWPPWLFRLATPVSVYAALEEIAITFVLPKSRSNVRSFWHLVGKQAIHRDREPNG
ncbi:MAG: CDP-alcohol phosphatidyltransferase family protein [Candidatus Tectomicrobia bacterium]|nr:CDP-alcohol phosphatidyltransferase family protein [Candidatus Tectomicrobia bacterium]